MTPGTRLGAYEVIAPLGAGGMGEVFKARDTRLDRFVAIKMLPPALAADPARRERFEREARSVSKLEHPHICALYDVGEHEGHLYIVMQFLDGETLAEKLTKGPLSIRHTIDYAIQIADALAAAHRAGIVHRDLKPANVMITRSGAQLLDFGLARTVALGGPASETVPGQPATLTTAGTVLGTLYYMAPEQLDGRDVDTRADIFSFGATLYEMVTGLKAFEAESPARVMSAILRDEPARVSTLVPITPAGLDELIHTCLAKDPNDRWQNLTDVARQLRWLQSSLSGGKSGSTKLPSDLFPARPRSWVRPLALTAAVIVLVLGALAMGRRFSSSAPPPAGLRLHATLAPPEGRHMTNGVALSPDRTRVAIVATDAGGRRQLWIRPLDADSPRLVEGSDDVSDPFWSPDSSQIAFFAESKLKRVPVEGGSITTICDAGVGGGGTWGANNTIVFAPHQQGPLMKVSAAGGRPEPATTLDTAKEETHHLYPAFLPDGTHYVFYINSKERGLYVASVENGERTRLFDPDPALPPAAAVTPGIYAASGHLYYVRDRVLMAMPFDPNRRVVTGEPVKVADTVDYEPPGEAAFTIAGDVLIYRAQPDPPTANLTWVDRSGKQVSAIDMPPGSFQRLAMTTDGRRVAMDRRDAQGLMTMWVAELATGRTEQVPSTYWSGAPMWSHDGTQLAFSVAQDSPPNIVVRADGGRGKERRLTTSSATQYPTDWTPDARRIVFQEFSTDTGWDLSAVGTEDGAKPQRVLKTNANETQARISPDGRWIAYASDESGRAEIYVARFPEMEPKTKVSTEGGGRPMWRRDGRELYYATGKGAVVAMTFDPATGAAAQGVPLFQTDLYLGLFSPDPDGRRFLIARPAAVGRAVPLELVMNPLK